MTVDARVLAPFLDRPQRAALLTDFDGTLAPIVDDPNAAVALPGTAEVLTRLAVRFGVVGVISGRSVSYLLDRLGPAASALSLRGVYGLERADFGQVSEQDDLAEWRDVLGHVADQADRDAPEGVGVERKGLAVTLHVRNAPAAAEWMASFADAVVADHGLATHPGRMSVEIRPPVDIDKGTVVRELGAGMDAVCFLGDDRGDLPAFAALVDLRRAGAATLAVAVSSPEAPADLLDQADLVVDGPTEAQALLRQLAAG
ncbi:MAG: trehalose-phosphatase [Actinomycetota bacterium]|nr:trehalose-phosphatase [Actinomycetota bacterium]